MLETYRYYSSKFSESFHIYELTGDDVSDFLQNQSTFNFTKLTNQKFHLTSFLDPQGRVEFYAWVLKEKDRVRLLTPRELSSVALIRLEKFLISEDVTINDLGLQDWTIVLGPKSRSYVDDKAFEGIMFEETAFLTQSKSLASDLKTEEKELWRGLNGWPTLDGHQFVPEIINNLRLYDLSVSANKGCYPGQETVSKIATRRGAAYSPVLLKVDKRESPGPLYKFDKKIGEIENSYQWGKDVYLSAKLLRDFRVEGMKISFTKNEQESEGIVCYYPLLSGSASDKALELYYQGTDAFREDDLKLAEAKIRQAIEIDPTLADAYESLGVMLGRVERFQEAIDLMDKLTEIDPSSVLAHTNKSLYLMRLGKIEEAEEQKSLATIKSFQRFGDEAKLKEKIQQEKKHQEDEWAKREDMFRQVLEIDEEDTLANFGLGSIAVEKNLWTIAIDHLEKVIKADANYSVAYLSLGKAYKGSGDKEKAQAVWKEGIAIAAKKGDLMPANQMQSELQSL